MTKPEVPKRNKATDSATEIVAQVVNTPLPDTNFVDARTQEERDNAPDIKITTTDSPNILIMCGKCAKPKKLDGMPPPEHPEAWCNCGRPTLYTQELLAKAREYVGINMPNKDTDEVIHSIEGLADYIGISRETIYVWSKEKEKEMFSDIVKEVLIKQGKMLINKGLSGVFESPITKVMMTKHGYHDKTENLNVDVPIDPETKKQADEAIDDFLKDKEEKK